MFVVVVASHEMYISMQLLPSDHMKSVEMIESSSIAESSAVLVEVAVDGTYTIYCYTTKHNIHHAATLAVAKWFSNS